MVYTEKELILPTLKLLRESKDGLDTSQIIEALTTILKPTGHDAEIIQGRNDTYFSQKVRNLKSHDTLETKGLATYEDGMFRITPKGLVYIEENEPLHESLEEQGFTKEQIDNEIDNDYKGVVIEEGTLERRNVTQRKRSDKLRTKAIEKYKAENGNKLPCKACDFDFEDTYGEHGKGFIEIHHTKPVHESDIEGTQQEINEALKKVVPLCSNCHRMVHRKKNSMLSVEELKNLIED